MKGFQHGGPVIRGGFCGTLYSAVIKELRGNVIGWSAQSRYPELQTVDLKLQTLKHLKPKPQTTCASLHTRAP